MTLLLSLLALWQSMCLASMPMLQHTEITASRYSTFLILVIRLMLVLLMILSVMLLIIINVSFLMLVAFMCQDRMRTSDRKLEVAVLRYSTFLILVIRLMLVPLMILFVMQPMVMLVCLILLRIFMFLVNIFMLRHKLMMVWRY